MFSMYSVFALNVGVLPNHLIIFELFVNVNEFPAVKYIFVSSGESGAELIVNEVN